VATLIGRSSRQRNESIFRRPLDVIDDEDISHRLLHDYLEPKLLLKCREQRGAIVHRNGISRCGGPGLRLVL
jgi:hypothetical protein